MCHQHGYPSALLPIVHRFWQVIRATSRILTDLVYVGLSWSSCFCSAIWGGLRTTGKSYIPNFHFKSNWINFISIFILKKKKTVRKKIPQCTDIIVKTKKILNKIYSNIISIKIYESRRKWGIWHKTISAQHWLQIWWSRSDCDYFYRFTSLR